MGAADAARERAEADLEQSRQERLRLGTGVLVHALGVAALAAGDLDRAEQWATSLYEHESEVCYLAWHAQEILVAALAGTVLGDENLKRAFEEGARLSVEEAVAYAQRGRGEHASATHGWASLSPVQRQVVELASHGLNPNIARELFMSRNAVKAHLSHAYAKLGVANRTELARLAAHHSQDRQQR